MRVRNDLVGCFIARVNEVGDGYEFLQLRRAVDDFMGGTWQTVAGCMEPGETAWQAALRELEEEAGLIPKEFYRSGIIGSFYIPGATVETDQLFHQTMFLAVVSREQIVRLNEEHDDIRWIHQDRITENFMWPEERRILRHLCEDILGAGSARDHLRIVVPIEGWRSETSGPAESAGRPHGEM